MLLISVEGAAAAVLAYWLLTRFWNGLTDRGPGRGFWNVFADVSATIIFGAAVLAFECKDGDIPGFAGGNPALWVLVLTPFVGYFYLVSRFAVWRWRRYRRAIEGAGVVGVQFQPPSGWAEYFKPTSLLSWVIYVWFALWLYWQICRAFFPAAIPTWMS